MAQPSTTLGFTFRGATLDVLRQELNRFVGLVAQQIDTMRGVRGTPTFEAAPDFKGHRAMHVGPPEDFNDAQILGRSLSRGDPGSPWDAQGNVVTHVAEGRDRTDAVNVGQLQDGLKKSGILTVSTDTPQTVEAGDVGDPGSGTVVSAANHIHPVSTALAADIQPTGLANLAGTATTLPRADHVHQVRLPEILTANLPAIGAAENGRIVIENTGTTLNLVIYASGVRARLTGVLF